jgi:hypothetical protein
MIQEYPTDSDSGTHGVGGNTEPDAVDFTTQADIANGSYAANDGNGICQVCHTQTASFADNDTTPLGGSHPTSGLNPCSGCHKHDEGFKASGCSGCHGGGTTGATAANYWPDNVNNSNPENDQPGAHLLHMTRLADKVYTGLTIAGLLDDADSDTKQKALCEYCHATPGQDGDHGQTLPADVNVGKTPTGAADNITYNADPAFTCDTSDCHNNKTTPSWLTTDSTCTKCHTTGGGGIVDPFAGGSGTCTTCHSSMPSPLTNGVTHADGTDNGNTVGNLGLNAQLQYSQSAADKGSCFNTGGSTLTNCHNGAGDNRTWARLWDATVSYANDGATECAGCHGGFSNDWTFGTDNATGDGAVSHDRDWDGAQSGNDGAEVIGNHSGTLQAERCNICHVYGDTEYDWASRHRNNQITMNSTFGYTDGGGTPYSCTGACHTGTDNDNHNLEDSGWTVGSLAGPAPSCTGCHTGNGSGALAVGTGSSHSTSTLPGNPTCESCHFANHGEKTSGTVSAAWDARTMGTDYTADGFIYITAYSGAGNEAEACWNCHAANSYSEWGKTWGSYDNGTINSGPSWLTGVWKSANFAYKNPSNQTFQSVHEPKLGSPNYTMPGNSDNISCTACHDVHSAGNNGYTPTTNSRLRGTWKSNPYYEDGAPQDYHTYTAGTSLYDGNSAEGVPRASGDDYATIGTLGGYWIDQNSGDPNSGLTYGDHASLCTLCHGDTDYDPNTVNPADITAIEGLWDGHKNTVAGGNNGGTNNIFRNSLRNGDGTWNGGMWMGAVNSIRRDTGKDYAGSLRNEDYGDGLTNPQVANNPRAWQGFYWGVTVDDTTVDDTFHNFTCSKCHNPHASWLPRLMITNCLDVEHNTWDDQFTGDSNWSTWTSSTLDYNTQELGKTSTAQNCHRYDSTNGEAGWNSITPW